MKQLFKQTKNRGILSLPRVFAWLLILSTGLPHALAQETTVNGKVKDEAGNPLPGVTIIVQKSTRGTTTQKDGSFSIKVPSHDVKLEFSYIGYLSQVVSVPANNILNITLKEATSEMEEVVVVGYATMRKVDVTGTVSSVSAKDIANVPVSSVAEALTGKLAGVRVVTQDGEPGAEVDITVRGGMSITQDNSPLYVIDGFVSDIGLQGLDISEIESIDVLKDASTTAIYGAQGANGVVLITTKSGKKGRTVVSYDSYYGFRQLARNVDVLNSVDFVKLQYEMAQRTGGTSITSFEENYGTWDTFESTYGSRGLDWQDIMFGDNAFYQNQRVSVSGGGDRHKFLLNYSYNDENGILMNTGNTKHTFRFKFDQQLFKGADLQTNISYYHNKKQGNITSGKTLQNSLLYRPVGGIQYTEDDLLDAMEDPSGNSLENPRAAQLSQLRNKYNQNLSINAALNIKFLKHFTLRLSGSGTWKHGRDDSFDDATSSAAQTRGGAFGSQDYSEATKWQNTNTLAYDQSFGRHNVNVMLGTEYTKSKSQGIGIENRQFPDDNFGIYDLSMGSLPQKPTTSYSEDALMSFFGRAFYNYDNRYLATFSLRADGSSKFAKENRWGYFPSASVAWRIDNESFLRNVKAISNLKLRLSYGQAGNNRIGNNRFRSTFETGWYTDGASEVWTLYPEVLSNPDLKWETTIASNIGLDFGFFNNRISGTVEFYKNKTKDLLLTSSIPTYTGYKKQTRNIGSLQNKGIEISLSTVNIRTKNFQWTSDFNISFNRNKVLSLTDTAEDYMLFKSGVGSYMDDFMVQIGQSTGAIYGYVSEGFYGVDDFNATYDEESGRWEYTLKDEILSHADQTRANVQPGSPKYKNVNGDNTINADDRTIIGNTTPKHFGGFNNTFVYKGFDLSVFLNWSYGNDILNYQSARLSATYQLNQNQLGKLRNRFTYIDANGNYVSEPEALKALNANATMHGVKTNGLESNITYTTSDYVEDGSFLRINNVTLGYSFNSNLIKKIGLNKLRVYATVYNLHTFTKYSGFDPEVNKRSNGGLTPGVDWSAYPKTRSYVFGINITF